MITKSLFGTTQAGEPVIQYHLENTKGIAVTVIDYGGTITEMIVPDQNGNPTDVCLGYDTVAEYQANDGYFGTLIGRNANRIQNGFFELNGKTHILVVNDSPNHLHGGRRGFDKYRWESTIREDQLVLSRTSPDGEEGYPGNLQVKATYYLTEDNTLGIAYEAESDADTIVNLTNHTYFNLNGHNKGTVLDHRLQVFADSFTENDADCLPTGSILPVAGTPFDFTSPKRIGQDISQSNVQLQNGKGYDHNWVLADKAKMKKAAKLYSPETGIALTVYTTMPGIQVYTANSLTSRRGKGGAHYAEKSGICLETQFFPNALACPNFPSTVLKKGEVYRQITEYGFETLLKG